MRGHFLDSRRRFDFSGRLFCMAARAGCLTFSRYIQRRNNTHQYKRLAGFMRFVSRPLAQLSSSHRVTLLASCSTNPTRFETISPVTTAPNEHLRTTSSASLTARFPPIVGHVSW